MSPGVAVERAARDRRSHARTATPAGAPEPLTLSPPAATADLASWAGLGLASTLVIVFAGLVAVGVRQTRSRRGSAHAAP